MPRLHEPDLAVGPVQRAKHAVDAVAGVAKDVAHAPLMQALHDEVTDGLGHGTARCKKSYVWRTIEFAACSKSHLVIRQMRNRATRRILVTRSSPHLPVSRVHSCRPDQRSVPAGSSSMEPIPRARRARARNYLDSRWTRGHDRWLARTSPSKSRYAAPVELESRRDCL